MFRFFVQNYRYIKLPKKMISLAIHTSSEAIKLIRLTYINNLCNLPLEMLAELGLSDVSDVSDPDFDDDSVPLSSHASLKQSGKPPPGPKRQSSTGDDWETDTPRSTAKPKVPLSARVSQKYVTSKLYDFHLRMYTLPVPLDKETYHSC